MANMFSGNLEKKIPKNFKDCYKTDSISQNLWLWCERLETWGLRLCILLGIIGIIDIISNGIEMSNLLKELNIDMNEIRTAAAEYNIEIKSVFEVVVEGIFDWVFYCFIEYCSYHILALLIGSLASIVQNTKITANLTLYNCAKIEGANVDYEEECEEEPKETVEKKKSVTKTNDIPSGFKKCAYCKELSPIETERCSCGCLAFETNNSENSEKLNDSHTKSNIVHNGVIPNYYEKEDIYSCPRCGCTLKKGQEECLCSTVIDWSNIE